MGVGEGETQEGQDVGDKEEGYLVQRESIYHVGLESRASVG